MSTSTTTAVLLLILLVLPPPWCASGCVVECRICNREVAGSNLSLGYFAPRSAQPSIPPGSVNEYQLRLGRQRQAWLIPIADERVDVQVKLWDPLRTRAIPEHFCGGDSLWRGAISSVWTFTLYLYHHHYYYHTKVLQGSVASRLWYDVMFNDQYVTQSLLSPKVKDFMKLFWRFFVIFENLIFLENRATFAEVIGMNQD